MSAGIGVKKGVITSQAVLIPMLCIILLVSCAYPDSTPSSSPVPATTSISSTSQPDSTLVPFPDISQQLLLLFDKMVFQFAKGLGYFFQLIFPGLLPNFHLLLLPLNFHPQPTR